LTEALLILMGVLLAVTVGAAVEYYRELCNIKSEYEKAKEAVEDIVLSFNRQLKREEERLEFVAYRVEANSSKNDDALRRAEEAHRRLVALEPRIGVGLKDGEKISARLNEVEKKMHDFVASLEALATKVSDVEKQAQKSLLIPEAKVEAVIPIKRERALAPLTVTELSVLKMLATEGPKTAPKIKDAIKLSREHTARLMKKLYEEGYLERDTGKIPFKYRLKKEMKKLLKKTKSKTV
jgi:uncharacterized coiled-coil protein SlyX